MVGTTYLGLVLLVGLTVAWRLRRSTSTGAADGRSGRGMAAAWLSAIKLFPQCEGLTIT